MNSKTSLLMIICVALILVLGCGSNDTLVSSSSDESPLPKSEEPLPAPNAPELGRIVFNVTYTDHPSAKLARALAVDKMTAYVYDPDRMEIARADLEHVGDRGRTEITVPAGDGYAVELVAYEGNLVRYLGDDEDVDVRAGETTTADITMQSTTPILIDPGETDEDGSYVVSWSAVDWAESYRLEEDNDPSFSSSVVVYTGVDTSSYISGRGRGIYYYRVRVITDYGDGVWSNVESIEVLPVGTIEIDVPWPEEGVPGEWTKYEGNPVLDIGAPGEWDDVVVGSPSVILDGGTYKMWYYGWGGETGYGRIGYATSSDGINWTKYEGNPVLGQGAPGEWDDTIAAETRFVILEAGTYKMWYQGHDGSNGRIGYATSFDGISWAKYGGNPVLDLGATGEWDDTGIGHPSVILEGGTYKMWHVGYDGLNKRIGYATSLDGVNWTKYAGNPVLDLGPSGEWDNTHVGDPLVILDGGYKMWYSGYDGSNERIGYATSSDGVNWMKYEGNPVLDLSAPGEWDDTHIRHSSAILDGGTYKMWYEGHDGSNWRIGYATLIP